MTNNKKRIMLPQEFYNKPADTRVIMTLEEADELFHHYAGWVIINEVMWLLHSRPWDDDRVELRLEQAGGLD